MNDELRRKKKAEYMREYRKRNLEKALAYEKRRRSKESYKQYMKEYRQRPEVKARKRELGHRPAYMEAQRERAHNRRQRPGFREKENDRLRAKYKDPKYRAKRNKYKYVRQARIENLPHDFTEEDWAEALELFDGVCAYCGDEWKCQEHFIPVTLGGGYEIGNIVPACKSCNSSKRDKHPCDWLGMRKYLDVLEIAHGV